MSSYEKWGLVLTAVGVTLNLLLFIAFAYQLRLIRKQVEQASEITRLDHDRRKKQATLEWASSAFERQWVFNKGMPAFHDFAAFRDTQASRTPPITSQIW